MRDGGEQIILRDEHRYLAHPHVAVLSTGDWLLVANRGPRRAVTMHPPSDPEFTNILMRSSDEGRTWSPPAAAPAYGATGTECAGLTALPNGGVLLNQMRFRWYPYSALPAPGSEPLLATSEELRRALLASSELETAAVAALPAEELMPWARGGCDTMVFRSDDGGKSFWRSSVLNTEPFTGGYGMRGAVVFSDGDILLPLSDAPRYEQVFAHRSCDGGHCWGSPEPIAATPGLFFEEPAPFRFADDDVLILLRENVSRSLFSIRSRDGGATWSAPKPTNIPAYPAHLLSLPDGRTVLVAGHRQPPYGIIAYFSSDRGESFDLDHPLIVRTGLPNKDLGYPTAALRSDGSLYVAYYYRDAGGVTALYATSAAL